MKLQYMTLRKSYQDLVDKGSEDKDYSGLVNQLSKLKLKLDKEI